MLAEVERANGNESLQAALVLNRVVDARMYGGKAGDPASAKLARRAVGITEKILGLDHPVVATSLNNLALLFKDTGDYAGARPLLERALAIREKALGPNHPYVASSLNSLALLFKDTGDYAGARPLYERALAIWEKALGPDHADVAIGLNNLAMLLRQTGDSAGARPLLERALAIHEKALGPNHPNVASSLNNLGGLLEDTGDYAGARPLCERALAIFEKALGPSHPDVAMSLIDLAVLLLRQDEGKAALNYALRAESIGREHFRAIAGVLPERQALGFAAIRSTGMNVALSLVGRLPVSGTKSRVFEALMHSRALVLDEMAARHRSLRASSDPKVEPLMAEYRSASARYATLLVRGPDPIRPEGYRPQLDQAHQEMERAERQLAEKSAAFRRQQRERGIGLAEVATTLSRGAAMVGIALFMHFEVGKGAKPVPSYLAYVLRAGTDSIAVAQLGPARGLDSLITRWREEAGAGALRGPPGLSERAYRQAGEALRQKLWDPLTPCLKGIDRVFVVPDGAVNLVNLATLPQEDGSYLVEKGPLIHYLSAERDLVTLGSLREEGKGLLALGGPEFDKRPSAVLASSGPGSDAPTQMAAASASSSYRGPRSGCAEFGTLHFGPLPGTLREVEEIGALWNAGQALQLTGAQASERAFKQNAPGHAVLHLATHGFFIAGQCHSALEERERGVGALVMESPGGPAPAVATGENPLVLSGLALAGANRRAEARPEDDDGILTAEEIAALDLSGVDWAVLSACETGVGDVRAGEGVFGLRRAFQVAGARTLIMSLWSVEDEAARRWMRALYEGRFQRRLSTAEAVREASLTLLRERRAQGLSTHPFYWGAFVAAGDWR